MECYHCGQENNDDAIYCKQCGERIDGKTICPSCKKLIDEDSTFCAYCGQNMQSQEEYEDDDNFKSVDYDDNRISYLPLNKKPIGNTISTVFSLATVFFALLFTFFIGIKLSIPSISSTASDAIMSNTMTSNVNYDLYYYFGAVYKTLDSLKESLNEFTSDYGLYLSMNYFKAIMGTILSIAIILAVVTFSIITLVKSVERLKDNSKNTSYNFALTTYLSYISGVALFYMFNCAGAQAYTLDVTTQLNTYTVMGIILSTICVFIATVGKALSTEDILTRQKVAYSCFTILGILILTTLTFLIVSPSTVIKNDDQSIRMNVFTSMIYLSLSFAFKYSSAKDVIFPTGASVAYVTSLIIEIAIIIMIAVVIATKLKNLLSNKKQSHVAELIISIVMSALSIIYLIVGNYANNRLADFISTEAEITTSVMPYVLILIISLAYTAVEVILNVSIKMIARKEN